MVTPAENAASVLLIFLCGGTLGYVGPTAVLLAGNAFFSGGNTVVGIYESAARSWPGRTA